ncbi:thioredoxin family protein [Cytobacillus massiliigabonensis]|uniref:thioredoxin family protein n=1 Tax=Cytobacillus massiliigabonensis TaxID=1871011 RepID=UPI000C81E46B|nr:thioredoxin family protein [Cytobacillus massiliigabonensis]
MKKVIIFLAVIILLFGAVALLTKMQNEEKVTEENPYGKGNLHPETIAQLEDPNYQNLILPDQLEKKLDNKEDVTVYFYSSTCPHCKRTTPIVAPLAKDMNIDLVQFNLQEFDNGWDQYGIIETPTIVQYKAGKEVNRITQYQEKEVFEKWFEENSK